MRGIQPDQVSRNTTKLQEKKKKKSDLAARTHKKTDRSEQGSETDPRA